MFRQSKLDNLHSLYALIDEINKICRLNDVFAEEIFVICIAYLNEKMMLKNSLLKGIDEDTLKGIIEHLKMLVDDAIREDNFRSKWGLEWLSDEEFFEKIELRKVILKKIGGKWNPKQLFNKAFYTKIYKSEKAPLLANFTTKPIKQGRLDSLASIYAIINSLNNIYRFTNDGVLEIFQMCVEIIDSGKVKYATEGKTTTFLSLHCALTNGIGYLPLFAILGEVVDTINKKFLPNETKRGEIFKAVEAGKKIVFDKYDPKEGNEKAVLNKIEKFLESNHPSAVILPVNQYKADGTWEADTWTTIRKIDVQNIVLSDSDLLKFIPKKDLRIGSSQKPKQGLSYTEGDPLIFISLEPKKLAK